MCTIRVHLFEVQNETKLLRSLQMLTSGVWQILEKSEVGISYIPIPNIWVVIIWVFSLCKKKNNWALHL